MTISNKIERYHMVNDRIVDAIVSDDERALRLYDRESDSLIKEILGAQPSSREEMLSMVKLLLSLLSPEDERGSQQHQIVAKILSVIAQTMA